MYYRITLTAETTDGPRSVTTERIDDLGEALDSMHGMIAAVGEENLISARIERFTRA